MLSLFYGLAIRTRNLLYNLGWKKTHRLGIPVISVGNLSVGGTGKTPCVEYIARWYADHGLRVTILSRGYGSKQGSNDEALVLEENLPDVPHLQGKDRVALGRIAVAELESEILVLDDGFQHRRLARDLDIVLVDATNPWGFDNLLPRGLLREPRNGLRRAHLVLLTRCDQAEWGKVEEIRKCIQALIPKTPLVLTNHSPVKLVNASRESADLKLLQGKKVIGFCGIGNPRAFRKTIVQLGAEVVAFRNFPDHHNYTRDDIEEIRGWVRQQAMECVVVTTQKDLVKVRLTQIGNRPLWAVQIQLRITEGSELLDRNLEEAKW